VTVAGSPDPVPANIGQCTSRQEQKGWSSAREGVSILLDRVSAAVSETANGQTGLHGRFFLLSSSLPSSSLPPRKNSTKHVSRARNQAAEIIVNSLPPVYCGLFGYLSVPTKPSNAVYLNASGN